MHLDTDRLVLRALEPDDLDALAVLLGDAEALWHWGRPLTREQARDWIDRNRRRYAQDGFGRCAMVLRETGELVGDCGLHRTTVEARPEVELGWIVRRSQQGRGLATEAAAAWRDAAFGMLGLERIVSMIAEDNTASRRVAERIGLQLERPAVWDGEAMLMYSADDR